MSRSALWRQEGNVKERERRAEELFAAAVEEGQRRDRSKQVLPLWGPDDSFHFNPLLLRNTIHSPYFQKCVETLHDWNAVIDEIYYQVKHLMPFAAPNDPNKLPSTAFCLLLRLLTLRMTTHQLDLTLKHADSPYIRGIGFLYLRFAGPPDQIYQWISPYLHDEEEFSVEPAAASKLITMGDFVRELFQSRNYQGTPLPRFPIAVERELQVQLLLADKVAERAALHFQNQSRMQYFQTVGSTVMALYGDDENPITWYQAVVDRVILRDEHGLLLKHPKFVVTFVEYGNTETVLLGEMDVVDGDWRRDRLAAPAVAASGAAMSNDGRRRDQDDTRDGSHKNKSNHRPGDFGASSRSGSHDRPAATVISSHDYLYEEVRRRERETVTADKGWAKRPPSTKRLLASASTQKHYTDEPYEKSETPSTTAPGSHLNVMQGGTTTEDTYETTSQQQAGPDGTQSKKRSVEEMAAIAEKKRKLLAKYG